MVQPILMWTKSIKYTDGRESTVSVRDLVPCPETELTTEFPEKWNQIGVPPFVPIL